VAFFCSRTPSETHIFPFSRLSLADCEGLKTHDIQNLGGQSWQTVAYCWKLFFSGTPEGEEFAFYIPQVLLSFVGRTVIFLYLKKHKYLFSFSLYASQVLLSHKVFWKMFSSKRNLLLLRSFCKALLLYDSTRLLKFCPYLKYLINI